MFRVVTTAVAVTVAASFAIAVPSATAAPQGKGHAVHAQAHPVHPAKPVKAAKPVKPGKPTSSGNADKTKGPKGQMTAAEHLQKSPQLAQKLAALLPANTNLETAAAGFKNFGQFVAAAHVSSNLGIPFDQLKTQMTGEQKKSLGQAVKTLKPDATDEAVKKAEAQAKKDVGGE